MPRRYVAVCGASDATPSQLESAREVGRLLAEAPHLKKRVVAKADRRYIIYFERAQG